MSAAVSAYLDCNATAPLRPEVLARMAEWLGRTGNASSVHGAGRPARAAVEEARADVAALVNADPEQVWFTSGGTESDNWALRAFPEHPLIVSAIEHEAVRNVRADARIVPVGEDGVIDLDALQAEIAACDRPPLVSLMLANNETGVVQPVAAAARLVHAAGGLLHSDAVQGPGKLGIDMAALDADLLSLSGHKFGGPQGIGALVARPGLEPAPMLAGGGQERRRRAGTENVAAIAGFGLACRIAAELQAEEARDIKALRDHVEAGIARVSEGRAVVAGASAERLPNTACIALPGLPSELQVMTLDLAGIAVSAGSACSSGKVTESHVLRAMGLGPEIAGSAIRVSFGWASTQAEAEAFLEAWGGMYERLGKRTAAE